MTAPTAPTPNVPLLRKAVEFAEASAARRKTFREVLPPEVHSSYHQSFLAESDSESDPDNLIWNQAQWSDVKVRNVSSPEEATLEHCGTAYCIAGFVNSQHPEYDVSLDTRSISDGTYRVYLRETIAGRPIEQLTAAQEALGLTIQQAYALFDGDNKIEDVRKIAETIAGEKL